MVNEVFTHSDAPAVDLIELYNTTAVPIDISGWYLSDSSPDYKKYRVPNGTILGAGNTSFSTKHNSDFGLNSAQGDDVWLLSADLAGNFEGFEDHVDFDAAGDRVSFGRWPNGSGDLYPMTTPTFAGVYGVSTSQGANSGPRIGPIVITEVMYNPPGDNPDLEFVELTNLLNQPITLSQTFAGFESLAHSLGKSMGSGTASRPARQSPPMAFSCAPFRPGQSKAAKLAAFQSTYNVGAGVQMVGGGTGLLDNAGEEIQLQRPDEPVLVGATTVVPYVMVDEVNYKPTSPWPTSSSQELGDSLTRFSAIVYGDDPTNWSGAAATPGLAGQFRVYRGTPMATTR